MRGRDACRGTSRHISGQLCVRGEDGECEINILEYDDIGGCGWVLGRAVLPRRMWLGSRQGCVRVRVRMWLGSRQGCASSCSSCCVSASTS